MKYYKGDPEDRNRVQIESEQGNSILTPGRSQGIYNHSPDGFNWGYHGSGPAQLALALLLDYFDYNKVQALQYHQDFKAKIVATWPADHPWEISREEMQSAIAEIDYERSVR